MKKILFLAVMLLAGYGQRLNAQSPACLAAGYLSPTITSIQTSIDTPMQVSAAETWFKVLGMTDSSVFRLTSSITGHRYQVDKIEIYKGPNCGSLSFLGKDSLEAAGDSVLLVSTGNHTATDTLYVRTTYVTNSLCPSCPNTSLDFRVQMWYLYSVAPCPTCNTWTGCNLVCNGTFETNNGFQQHTGNITDACGWSSLNTASPDYYHTSSTYSSTVVPCNWVGHQNPAGGNGYAGFGAYPSNTSAGHPGAYSEYITTQLLSPLVAGETYTVSFKLVAVESNKLEGNKVGVFVYNTVPASVSGSDSPISTLVPSAQIYTVSTIGLSYDTWTTFTLAITPNANYQRIAFGNFSDSYSWVTCNTSNPWNCGSYLCSWDHYTFIDDISVTGFISIPHTYTSCPGNPTVLTSQLNGPWSWSGPFSFSATTQSVTVTYTSAYSYTVTGTTNGCAAQEVFNLNGIPANETISMTPGPPAINPITVCPGQPITFTASGLSNNTYTWYNSGLIAGYLPPPNPPYVPQSTGSTYTYTPSASPSTQVVSVYGNSVNGCGTYKTVIINVVPSVSAIISGEQSMCAHADHIDTYTATSQGPGVTYTWSVTCNGVNVPFTPAPNGQSITVDWTAYANGSNNGQVCLTVSAPGCSNSNACVQVPPCCMPSAEYVTVVGSQDPNNPTLLNTLPANAGGSNTLPVSLAMSGYFSIASGNLVDWSNVRLAMAPGTKIIVPTGAALRLSQCHFFGCNKMWDGIYSNGGTILFSKRNLFEDAVNAIVMLQSSPKLNINTVYFNKCQIGIDFRAAANTDSTSIYKCIFTSRNFGINTAGANLTSTYLGTGVGSIDNSYPGSNYTFYPSATMLVPNAGFRAKIGVNIADNVQVTVGINSTASADRNIFDNLFYGVMGTNSNVYVINNLFIYIQEHCNSGGSCREPASVVCPAGTAICTGNTSATQTSTPKFTKVGVSSTGTSTLYPNYFESDQYGVYNTVNRSLDARNNDFKRIDKVGIYNELGSNYYSNFPTTYPANVMNILNNKMDSVQTGIQLKDNRNALMVVTGNSFNWANYPAAPTASTQRSVSGIIVENAVVHTYGALYVNSNRMANLQKGITLTLQGYNGVGTAGRVRVFRNPVYFNQLQTSTVAIQHYGIGIFSCKRVTVDGDDTLGRIIRTITSPSTPTSLNITAQRELFSGVRIENSTETWVTDMNIVKTPVGIYAKGSCTFNNFWCNSFDANFNGVFLSNTASTTINDQLNLSGYVGAATGNKWFNSLAGGRVSGTAASFMSWYYVGSPGSNTDPNPPIGVTNISFVLTDHDACSFLLEPEDPPVDPEMRLSGAGPKVYETGTKPEKQFEGQSGNANQREIEGTPSLELYPAYLDSMGIAAAAQYNGEIAPYSDADIARKQVDLIHLNSWAQSITGFTSTDSSYLCDLATRDPEVYGSAVYSAIVMVGDCESIDIETERKMQTQNISIPLSVNKKMIYPNPNNGLMQTDILLKENESGTLEICDLSGITLSTYRLKAGNNNFTIDENRLSSGVYIYRIIVNEKITQTERLVIIK